MYSAYCIYCTRGNLKIEKWGIGYQLMGFFDSVTIEQIKILSSYFCQRRYIYGGSESALIDNG